MTFDHVGGIAYDLNFGAEQSAFEIHIASVVASRDGVSPLRCQKWIAALPDPNKYVEEFFGTSETRGIVGGVRQPILKEQSEIIERSLGDALTVCFADIVDGLSNVDTIIVLGPAFPKVLGRFLSLHPPKALNIAWIYPLSASQDFPLLRMLSPLNQYGGRAMDWSREALLNSFTFPISNPKWLVEFVDLGEREESFKYLKAILSDHSGEEELPRELAFARHLFQAQGEKSFVRSRSTPDLPDWMLIDIPDVAAPILTKAFGSQESELPFFRWQKEPNAEEFQFADFKLLISVDSVKIEEDDLQRSYRILMQLKEKDHLSLALVRDAVIGVRENLTKPSISTDLFLEEITERYAARKLIPLTLGDWQGILKL
jgi:hypothetical protein